MIVLDYWKKTVDNFIQIPAFHTGHLGFVPGTEVSIGLMKDKANKHCELLITPYQPQVGEMAYVYCVMEDAPGVVQPLLQAVSMLNINIVTEESSAINGLDHHEVNLIVDLSSSALSANQKANSNRQALYSEWRSLFPLEDERYVRLFESIMAHCGHLLIYDDFTRLPRIRISPLHTENAKPRYSSAVERDPVRNFQVRVKLPPQILSHVHNRLGTKSTEGLSYMLLSETDDRVLRVFFPNPALIARSLHLAFYHRDKPGALSTLTKLLAKEDFNILTSLLRKISLEESVWESILECRGAECLPPSGFEDQCSWVAKRLRARAAEEGLLLKEFEFKVGSPLYPMRKERVLNTSVPLVEDGDAEHTKSSTSDPPDQALHKRIHAGLALANVNGPAYRALQTVRAGVSQVKKSIFFSFPKNAKDHAHLLEAALGNDYEVRIYKAEGSEIIADGVNQMIRGCDYFLGIWHHDENLPIANGFFGISPWMHFEYGKASTLNKPCFIIHSSRLEPTIWQRINAGVANQEYKDLTFVKETIPDVVEQFKRHFP